MKLTVLIKNIYGKEMVYLACAKSKLICEMLGAKTLTEDTCYFLEQLGYTFEVLTPTMSGN